MGDNRRTGQLKGPFIANEELVTKIGMDADFTNFYIRQLGIQTDVGNLVSIDGDIREIGKTGIYEIGNTKIDSLFFIQDTDENSIIDYVIQDT